MCGRYTQVRPEPELAAFFEAEDLADLPPGRYNVAPTDLTAVVVERDGRRVVTAYRWGLVLHWADDPRAGARLINARAETIERLPVFRDSFARKRCLVPVDGFYEWRRTPDGQRQPFYITSADGSPLALAGLWSSWRPPEGEGPILRTCAIVTTTPNELMAPIHDRMPVIVARDAWGLWLDTSVDHRRELRGLFEPAPSDNLVAFPVGRFVNSVRNNGPELIRPLGPCGSDGVNPDPAVAASLARRPGWTATPIAHNEYGIATYRLEAPGEGWQFLKLSPRSGRHISLSAECARLRWAADYLPVPELIDCGTQGEDDWLITVGIDAPDGTSPAVLADPGALVEALARGLRRFHEAPVADCPFDFRLDAALALVRGRVEAGLVDPSVDFHPEHAGLSAVEALERLESRRPASEDLVVCHGDYCFPNALVVAFLDLGELGVADRWWDLAVATWSTTWNIGPGWEDAFLEAYGVDPDPDRISYYRLLYDLAS